MSFGPNENAAMLRAVAHAITANRGRLCELDGVIGDGDHGVSMDIGFAAIVARLDTEPQPTTLAQQYAVAAHSFLEAVGASCGPLYATAFLRVAAYLKPREDIEVADIAPILDAMAIGIADRGKAAVGDRTMLDVWRPVADEVAREAHSGGDTKRQLDTAVAVARRSMEATAWMLPKVGRAARLGERAIGHVDPGAASADIIIAAMAVSLRDLQ